MAVRPGRMTLLCVEELVLSRWTLRTGLKCPLDRKKTHATAVYTDQPLVGAAVGFMLCTMVPS